MPVDLTPTDKLVIMNLDQDEFLGFSYTNPEYVAPANQHALGDADGLAEKRGFRADRKEDWQ